jgi:hypothetical protein
MGEKAIKWERWRERAEEMLTIAEAMHDPEARAQMKTLAADWLSLADQQEAAADAPKSQPALSSFSPLATIRSAASGNGL